SWWRSPTGATGTSPTRRARRSRSHTATAETRCTPRCAARRVTWSSVRATSPHVQPPVPAPSSPPAREPRSTARQALGEPATCVRVVVVALDAAVAGPFVHGDRLDQRAVRVEVDLAVAEPPGLILERCEHPGSEPAAAPRA